jgi:hypothetical protein
MTNELIEVTDADRDIAADYNKRFPEIRLTEAFAAHRIQSTAEAVAEIERLREALGDIAKYDHGKSRDLRTPMELVYIAASALKGTNHDQS